MVAKKRSLWSILLILSLVGILFTGCSTNNTASNTPTPTENNTTPENTTEPEAEPSPDEPVDGGTITLSTFSDIVSLNPIFIMILLPVTWRSSCSPSCMT